MAEDKKATAPAETAAPVVPQAPVEAPVKTQLQILQDRADTLGVSYTSETSVEDLKKAVAAKLAGEEPKKEVASSTEVEDEFQRKNRERQEAFLEATKLIRVRITNMNPDKADLTCEIFTFSNGIIGSTSRTVPYGEQSDGWHVEQCILNMLMDKKFQQVRTIKGPNGQLIPQSKWVKEFAIEILEPLTPQELKVLANKQAAADGNGE